MKKRFISILLLLVTLFSIGATAIAGPGSGDDPLGPPFRVSPRAETPSPDYEIEFEDE